MEIPSKVIVFFFLVLTTILSIITLIFSFTQVNDITNGKYYKGGCDSGPVPYRAISTVNGKEIAYFQCGWSLTRSFVRCLLQFLIVITIVILFILYAKKKKSQFLILLVFLLLLGFAEFYSFGADASALKGSYDFCNNDSTLSIPGKECQFGRYYGTLAFNIATTISVCFVSIFTFIKRNKLFDDHNAHHQQFDKEIKGYANPSTRLSKGNEAYSSI
ncbi:hypothetical protein RB653_006593 [Dictyostelium firmibasis]|uniref:Uncharacterized protein n=1 Tax=Dictyostelium firmibasis TaxID=79012 RepID=A0AAN7TZU0_9MYCE